MRDNTPPMERHRQPEGGEATTWQQFGGGGGKGEGVRREKRTSGSRCGGLSLLSIQSNHILSTNFQVPGMQRLWPRLPSGWLTGCLSDWSVSLAAANQVMGTLHTGDFKGTNRKLQHGLSSCQPRQPPRTAASMRRNSGTSTGEEGLTRCPIFSGSVPGGIREVHKGWPWENESIRLQVSAGSRKREGGSKEHLELIQFASQGLRQSIV